MKKVILATLMAGLIPMIASAQGTIAFAAGSLNHKVTTDGTTPVGAGYLAALYWGALGSLEGSLVQLGAITTVNSANGVIVNGGVRTTGAGTAPGASATFQVRAWNGGWANYEDAVFNGAVTGKSQLFVNDTADPGNALDTTPILDKNTWTQPIIVPEPSTIALAGLGVAALLAFRRRK